MKMRSMLSTIRDTDLKCELAQQACQDGSDEQG